MFATRRRDRKKTLARARNTPRKFGDRPATLIQSRIVVIREQRVMLDADLARLYGVETRALVQAVKRDLARFPEDFMFQLSARERRGFEITDCDLKRRSRRPTHRALRVHRARRGDVVFGVG